MMPLVTFGVASLLLVSGADTVPRLPVESTCHAVANLGDGLNASPSTCLSDEQGARRELAAQWSTFSRGQKQNCIAADTAGGDPSYVELLECLTMARDALEMEKAERAAVTGQIARPAADPVRR